MRIDLGISSQHAPHPPPVIGYVDRPPAVEPSPHTLWLTILAAGTAFAAAEFALDVVWNTCVLGWRVRNFPSLHVVRACHPFVALGEVAFQWVAVWLLTTEDPGPRRGGRLVANLLRFLVTVLFLMLSADVLRLYEGFGWRSRSNWPWLATQCLDLIVSAIFWPYLAWLALHLDMKGMAWRAIAAMVAGFVSWIVFTGPWLLYRFMGMQLFTDKYFQNLIYGVVVLCSTIALLVLMRFSIHFRADAKRG